MSHLADQLRACISPLVTCVLINAAPQERVLGHSQHQSSLGADCPKKLGEDKFIFLNMLQHVKRANDVELSPKRQPAGVHLCELHAWQPLLRKSQSIRVYFSTCNSQRGKSLTKAG